MLKRELNRLKQSRKTSELPFSPLINFIDTPDLNEETLIEEISIDSPVLDKTFSIRRELLTIQENSELSCKIKIELLNLFKYINHSKIEYFLEYLIRKYRIDIFEAEELWFVLLPFEKYFQHFKIIDSKTFNLFENHEFYSVKYIAHLISNNYVFKQNFLVYFEYKNELSSFLKNVIEFLYEQKEIYEEFKLLFN